MQTELTLEELLEQLIQKMDRMIEKLDQEIQKQENCYE